MNEMKELMSSMIGEQIRAALPAPAVTGSVIPTTSSVVFGYGDSTQTSAAMGGSPMSVASHAHGTMATHVTSQVATGLDEEVMGSEAESEAPAQQGEQVPASYLDALNAVFKYLPENICPRRPLPPPRVVSLYEADSTPLPLEVPTLPFSPTVGGLLTHLENSLSKEKGGKARSTPSSFKKANAGKKFYVPHNSTWPVKPPPMDTDAGLVGVTGQAYPDKGAAKLLATLDSGLRVIVAMGVTHRLVLRCSQEGRGEST